MATVRISSSLQHEILHNVENMFSSRIQQARQEAEKQVSQFAEEFLEALVPKELREYVDNHLTKATVYMSVSKTLNIVYIIEGVSFVFSFTFYRNIPDQRNRYYEVSKESHPELYAKLVASQQTYISVVKERKTLVEQTRNLLNQVVTLRQLVDVWPSALEFVSDSVRERHYAKQTYTKRAKTDIALDESIKANLLKARIASDIGKS